MLILKPSPRSSDEPVPVAWDVAAFVWLSIAACCALWALSIVLVVITVS